jgi:arsenate reductase
MANGIVKFFNSAKGFGFITPEDGGKDVFIPATSIASSGVAGLKAGQLVAFETEPDTKGPKAVKLKILAEPPKQAPREAPREVKERPAPAASVRLTLYLNPASDESQTVLAALRDLGHEPRLVDYIATPPTRDELRNLSMLLRDADQSLARRYDTLFLELQLDDRFISENEFWTAIVEHPTLINGPVLASPSKARICRTENAVRSFLGLDPVAEKRAAKPKPVPETVAPAVKAEKEKVKKAPAKAEAKPAARKKADAPAPKKSKPEPKAKPAPKSKAVAKPKEAAKKAVKKTRRA